jgi:hypothetical protein
MLPKTLPFIVLTFTIKLASQCQAFMFNNSHESSLFWKVYNLVALNSCCQHYCPFIVSIHTSLSKSLNRLPSNQLMHYFKSCQNGLFTSPTNYMRCLPSSNFIFSQRANLIGPSLKKNKIWTLPRIEGFILKYRVPLLWPTYIGERRTTFAKACGIKVRCYGEHVGKHIGNLGNILGTWWETWEAPPNCSFYVRIECLPFGFIYIGEKERSLG